jgi:molybdopterin/thiamine biosynthesis adenylyltransferase
VPAACSSAPPPGAVPSCAEAGVLGATAGFAGALMGAEALRLLAGERARTRGAVHLRGALCARSARARPQAPRLRGVRRDAALRAERAGRLRCAAP